MKKIFSVCMLMLLSVTMAFAAKVDKIVNISVKDDNGNTETRTYRLYVPANVQENAPLVVSLHGANGNQYANRPMTTDVADTEGFIVVYPQGKTVNFYLAGMNTTGWIASGEDNADVEFIKAVIEDVAKNYTIDRKRIYCCGFSNGGMMTYALSNTCSDIFAAFASISGYQLNEFHFRHTGARPVPFLHIHGKADDFVLHSLMPTIVDEMVARIGANPVPEVTNVAGKYTKSVYAAGEGSFPYVYYEMDGMGHNDITSNTPEGNSAKTMWAHFKQYTLDTPCDPTIKWIPRVEEEGYKPAQHGWINTGKTILRFGGAKHAADNSDHNVYRSFQLDKGNYKLTFKSSGDTSKDFLVRIKKIGGEYVLDTTAKVGEDAAFCFKVEEGWGEYIFALTRNDADDDVTVTNIELRTATDEEMTNISSLEASSIVAPQYYNLAGIPSSQPQKGFNVVQMGSNASKTIFVK